MTDLLRHATDDQIALLFCFGGVFVSGMIMYFSFHVGQLGAQARSIDLNLLTEFQRRRDEPLPAREKAA